MKKDYEKRLQVKIGLMSDEIFREKMHGIWKRGQYQLFQKWWKYRRKAKETYTDRLEQWVKEIFYEPEKKKTKPRTIGLYD